MSGLTPLGVLHTAISVAAVLSGFFLLARDGQISPVTRLGRIYIVLTAVAALTGFGIFQHGGFGKPHILGIITLLTLFVAYIARRSFNFSGASKYVETVCYSATILFHLIPAITETSTRLPLHTPLLANAEAPALKAASATLIALFLVGTTVQVIYLKRREREQ